MLRDQCPVQPAGSLSDGGVVVTCCLASFRRQESSGRRAKHRDRQEVFGLPVASFSQPDRRSDPRRRSSAPVIARTVAVVFLGFIVFLVVEARSLVKPS